MRHWEGVNSIHGNLFGKDMGQDVSVYETLTCLLQTELVQFFRLQMAVHHPHGAKTPEEGAFAVDADLWRVKSYCLFIQVHYIVIF